MFIFIVTKDFAVLYRRNDDRIRKCFCDLVESNELEKTQLLALGVIFMTTTHLGMLRKETVNENLHNLIFCKHEVKNLDLNDISFTHL